MVPQDPVTATSCSDLSCVFCMQHGEHVHACLCALKKRCWYLGGDPFFAQSATLVNILPPTSQPFPFKLRGCFCKTRKATIVASFCERMTRSRKFAAAKTSHTHSANLDWSGEHVHQYSMAGPSFGWKEG
jgi:hypothetical protein